MDLQKFLQAKLAAREADIPVPALADFFGDEPAVWRVRALTAAELGRANESNSRTQSVKQLVAALASNGETAGAIRDALGLADDDVPTDVARRMDMLVYGSVAPAITREVSVRIAELYPTIFYELTNKVLELTGAGAELGKSMRSGRTDGSG